MAISNPEAVIIFRSPEEFKGEQFFIPDYQRGYRWTRQEVEDLLNDFKTFAEQYPDESYSMQPIVVKRKDDTKWEVVDGQQRLTTVRLILDALDGKEYYGIEYEVLNETSGDNINRFYIEQASETAREWIKNNVGENSVFKSNEALREFVTQRLKFLWYRADKVDDSSGEKIFRRLNIGKIELTQSELIKALFLSAKNFEKGPASRREEVARQWDEFEAILQNDEFLCFISNPDSSREPTRIEFLLRLVYRLHPDMFGEAADANEISKRDGLFRAYYAAYGKPDFLRIWDECVETIDILLQWYEDVSLYHLIGFLVTERTTLTELLNKWQSGPCTQFMKEIVGMIIEKYINNFDPDKVYCDDRGDRKYEARPYLLLSNLLQVLRQNIAHIANPNYAQGIFYKFPFHLYKKQIKGGGKGWDVEHIASATTNELEDDKDQREWILSALLFLGETGRNKFISGHIESLKTFFDGKQNETETVFETLRHELAEILHLPPEEPDFDKNRIWNYVLLDYSTNRGYGNAIFAAKRQHIRNKECGIIHTAVWNKEKAIVEIKKDPAPSAFVPPCTKDVFMKSYSQVPGNPMEWTKGDAEAYLKHINDLFDWFKTYNWSNL